MIVLDASVAVKWYVDEDDADRARALFATNQTLIAPELVVAEVCNAAWRLLRKGEITARQLDIIAEDVGDAFDRLVALPPLAPRAAALARQLDHPVYDCFYLALAEREGAPLVTADGRLIARLRSTPLAGLARPLASYGAPRP